MAASFHVEHFGCRAARADGEAVSDRLRAAGLCEGEPSAADVVVVNTCSVTAEADRAARAFIRRAHRLNPEARIVVTGCYAQRAPEELAAWPAWPRWWATATRRWRRRLFWAWLAMGLAAVCSAAGVGERSVAAAAGGAQASAGPT
jgi:hypothetical protein